MQFILRNLLHKVSKSKLRRDRDTEIESLALNRPSACFFPETRFIRAFSAVSNYTFFIHTSSLRAWDSVRTDPHILLSQPCPLTLPSLKWNLCTSFLGLSGREEVFIQQLGLKTQEAPHLGTSPQIVPLHQE